MSLVPRKILVVDDDREVCAALKALLEDEGYQVSVAYNGIHLLRSLKVERVDLILLDVMMSWIDGFELCRALQKNRDYAVIPVVFISGRTRPEDIDRGLACGARDYLTKPLDIPRLLARVRDLIGPENRPRLQPPGSSPPASQ
jgi:DNA-binding response OmpR family regulator